MPACLLAVLSLAALLAPAVSAQQGAGGDFGRVVWTRGDVRGRQVSQSAFGPLAKNDPLFLEMTVATGADALAYLLVDGFDGGFEIEEDTEIRMTEEDLTRYRINGRSVIEQLSGALTAFCGRAFRGAIRTTSAVIGIKGTVVYVRVDPSGRTTVVVLEGEVEVFSTAGGPSVIVPQGYRTSVEPEDPPRPPSPPRPPGPTDPGDSDLTDEPGPGFGPPDPGPPDLFPDSHDPP